MPAKRRDERKKGRATRLRKSIPPVFMAWRRAWELRKALARRIMKNAAPDAEWLAELRKELLPGSGGDDSDEGEDI